MGYRTPKISYTTSDVFAAACAAQRINGEYLKEDQNIYDADGYVTKVEKIANKKLTSQFLRGDFEISDADRVQGEAVRQHCNSLTFKILQGKNLSDFEQTMLRIADKEMIDSFYDIAVVSSLPASYARAMVRKEQDARLRDNHGTLAAAIGDVVELDIEVVRCNYSNTWEMHYITAIVDNAVVFFASQNKLEIGSKIRIKGKVKDHKEDRTQLARVKVK
jgi:hypothetical protein